jgi:hypothetical protein
VIFNLNFGAALSHRIPAAAIFAHPGFVGFNAPNLQHDIAIVELTQDVPAGVPVYPLHYAAISSGATMTLVGYGASGQGNLGQALGADAAVKRVGGNSADYFEADLDGSSHSAIFVYDFDGAGAANVLGNAGLGNARETCVAAGDSGSPSFISVSGIWKIAGVNTFATTFPGGATTPSIFGTGGGGNLVWPYQSWIQGVLSRPVNDSFANRIALTGAAGTATGTTVGATKEPGEPAHAGNPGAASTWWKWSSMADGTLTIDTAGSGFDTLLAAYTGDAVSRLMLVTMNDNAPNLGIASRISIPMQAGTEYDIAVDGYNGAAGAVVLSWRFAPGASLSDAETPALPGWGVALLAGVLTASVCRAATRQR